MKNIFRKITSALAGTLMIGSTIALAAAANYPAPFVQNGVADVAVVYGANAAATDLVAVTDITTSLQAALSAQAAAGEVSTGTTVAGGDFVLLAKSSDNLNLGNTMSGVFGTTVNDDDLATLLADGTYVNDENSEYDYEQKITLAALQLTHFADNDYKDKEPTVGFHISSNTIVMNYSIDFTTDPESDVSGGDLVDFETTDLILLGKTYYVSDFDNSTLKITLLDSANSGIVEEGDTVSMTVGGTTYDVRINYIDSDEVKFNVNGVITNKLQKGESYNVGGDVYVGVKDISKLEVSGETGSAEFSIGSGKLEIENGQDVELNDNSVSGVRATVVRGTPSGDRQKLDKIVLQWTTEDEEFITPDSDLVLPGFEAVKFSMGSFFVPKEEVTDIDYDGDDSIELTIPIKDGTASFNILYANASGEFTGIGKDSDELLATSSTSELIFNQSEDEWFVASYNTSDDSESYLLSATVTTSDNQNRTTIKNEVTDSDVCKDKTAGDTCDIGDVSLTINEVYKLGSEKRINITAGTGVSFDKIYSKEGLRVALPVDVSASGTQTADGAINTSASTAGHGYDTFYVFLTEEDKDDDIAEGTKFNVTINDDSDGKLTVSDVDTGRPDLEILGTDDNTESRVQSDIATKVERIVVSDRGKAVITYSGGESYAEAYITDTSAMVSGGAGGVTELGSVSVEDTAVSSVAGKNLIVVGGSCINSVAADLLGAPMCGADFEASTGVGAGSFLIQTFSRTGGKVATLVAGYNAGDTTNAAKALTTQSIDTTVGKKYTGTSATSVSLVTTAA